MGHNLRSTTPVQRAQFIWLITLEGLRAQPEFPGYCTMANAFNAALLRISNVEPLV
jgi:hypothetical protein